MEFAVDLPVYAGPMELLLFLVRRHELDLTTIHLAKLASQFADYLEVLSELDLDSVGEFLEIASMLIELKAKQMLPSEEKENASQEDQVLDDSSEQLVSRLVQYKQLRDMASILDDESRRCQMRYPRLAIDLSAPAKDPSEQPIADLEIWDLVSAFGRILRENRMVASTTVIYDDTPIHSHMKNIHQRILHENRIELQSLFPLRAHKSTLVGMFLATLELTRHHGVMAEQTYDGSSIYLVRGTQFQETLTVAEVENLASDAIERSNLPIRPR